jgi:hypothetical protein
MRNVFIYVKSGLKGGFSLPKTPAILTQLGCQYSPHVLGVMAGQGLRVVNDDNTLHNIKMTSSKNGSFNEGQPVKGMFKDTVLTKPEMGVSFRCDVHPWMGSRVYVLDHPFFSVSDVEGRYEIVGLAPGTYTLEAVHEDPKIAPFSFEVVVEGDASYRRDIQME